MVEHTHKCPVEINMITIRSSSGICHCRIPIRILLCMTLATLVCVVAGPSTTSWAWELRSQRQPLRGSTRHLWYWLNCVGKSKSSMASHVSLLRLLV
ncbi:hypothetical protein DEU56DRAFT_983084, partial [Suillus clintonianus]|uniref:uncharacterized protein n=1 Tax=Suillus clintonianus TaxID=1904413 RepID=UPI001B869BCE